MFTATDIVRRGADEDQFETVYLARQPILNAEGGLAAYELLFRSSEGRYCSDIDGLEATTNVIRNAFFGMGLQSVLAGSVGFINVDERFLLSDLVESLHPRTVVLEILETVSANPVLIARIRELRQRGYRFALDDYVGDFASIEEFLPYVDIVKFDIVAIAPEAIAAAMASFAPRKLRFLAEKVETSAQFEAAKALGFTLFQGFHFARPESMCGRQARTPHQSQLLHLITMLQKDHPDDRVILDEMKRHPTVAVKILGIANSSAMGLRSPVGSLQDALRLLGQKQVLRVINILLFAGQGETAVVKNPLFQTASSRGKLMEELIDKDPEATFEERDGAYIVGMLSLVDGLLAQPLHKVLEALRLPDTLSGAILHRSGRLGALLKLAEEVEMGDDLRVADSLAELPHLSRGDLMHLQLKAFAWTTALSAA